MPEQTTALIAEVEQGSLAYVRNLAAAEQAVQRGQFNVAKILRAAANAQRVIAFNAARILEAAASPAPDALLTTILAEQQPIVMRADRPVDKAGETTGATTGAMPQTVPFRYGPALPIFLEQSRAVHARVADLIRRSLDSLAAHPDILECDVAMKMYGCRVCGNPMEGDAPQQCDLCGAIRAEFLWIGPFYGETAELLGRLSPQQVLAIVAQTPEQMAALIAGVDDALLCRKPSPSEWCIKEIVAHSLEAHYTCVAEVQAILTHTPFTLAVAPWLTHVGKGYETRPAAALITQLNEACRATLALLQSLVPGDWSRVGYFGGASILESGTWVANHDLGHLAQVRRLLTAWQADPS